MGKVYLVGAGPGGRDLLTLRAHALITRADVLIHDRLVSADILADAPGGCERIHVGKARGRHTLDQATICELLAKKAAEHACVVRLKGGDPVIFGRGGEEAMFLARRKIAFEFVPGISSTYAVAELAGIPLTYRGIASGYRVVTGYEDPSKGYDQVVWECMQHHETLVIVMGLYRLDDIVTQLQSAGYRADTPVAVISRGASSHMQVVVDSLRHIAQAAKNLPTPAIIIVGEVVRLRDALISGKTHE